MVINWPLIVVLFGLAAPGVFIVMPRLISFLLQHNTDELKQRFSRFAVTQTLIMVFVMSFAGAVLSLRTGLNDPVLEALLQGKLGLEQIQNSLLPTVFYSLSGLVVFCCLYYGVVSPMIDKHSLVVMSKLRGALGVDGCVLYGGVVEEVIARWGLMNLVAFFAILFAKQSSNLVIWMAIIISALLFAVGQIPAYVAAGCNATRRFIYSLVLLSFWQSIVFGFIFWQYGLLAAILGHMLFHYGWARYDYIPRSNSESKRIDS